MAPINQAVWVEEYSKLTIGTNEYNTPRENEVVLENYAVAINPVDWAVTDGLFNLKPPYTLGCDVAGKVVQIGSNVKNVKVGDRVIGACSGITGGDQTRENSFQKYPIVKDFMVTKIPDNVKFTDASVLPLIFYTAAIGLYESDYLGLEIPTGNNQQKPGKVLLVWGGSSGVGSNAVQLGVASGYEVITTSSPSNAEMVKSLGASKVFNYHDSDVVSQMVDYLKGKTLVGIYDAVSSGAEVIEIMEKADKVEKKFIAKAVIPSEHEGIEQKMVQWDKISEFVYPISNGFLPEAIANGSYKLVPPANVVGKGFESIPKAFAIGREGVTMGAGFMLWDSKVRPDKNRKIVVSIRDE